jgi:hypothetical protein
MIVSYKKITVILILHPEKVFQGAEVITEVQIAC